MIKIAYVITDLNYGGAQTMLLQLLKNLNRDKYLPEVFIRDKRIGTDIENKIEKMGVRCHYFNIRDLNCNNKIFSKLRAFRLIKRELDIFNPTIVHSHLETFYSFLYCFIVRKQLIFTIHSFPDRIITWKHIVLLNQLKRMKLLQLVGCAKCVSDRMVEILGISFQSICLTIYNPIDNTEYDLPSKRNGNIFITIGRMEAIKNQILMIEAFKKLSEKNPNNFMYIVGEGPLRENIEQYIVKLNLQNKIFLLGNRNDISSLLSKADCFILSSISECCPMSILEAMSSGLPIISTDVGGVSEIVGAGGILVNTKAEMVAAMDLVCNNEEYRLGLGNISKKLSQKYNAGLIAEKYMKLYQQYG